MKIHGHLQRNLKSDGILSERRSLNPENHVCSALRKRLWEFRRDSKTQNQVNKVEQILALVDLKR